MGIIETLKLQATEEGKREGILEGKREGILEGKREESIAIATEMKKDGLPINQIAKFTKLTIAEIEKL